MKDMPKPGDNIIDGLYLKIEQLKRENHYLTLALEEEWSHLPPDILKRRIKDVKNGDI